VIQSKTGVRILCFSVTIKSGRTVTRLFHIQLKSIMIISYVIRSNPTQPFSTRYSYNDIAKDSYRLIEYKDRKTVSIMCK
jgi:hypothetical protein